MRHLLSFGTLCLLLAPSTSVQAQADAGPDSSLCATTTYTMQASPVPSGAFGFWTVVSGCGTFSNMNDPNALIMNLCVGSNVFQWVVDDGVNITVDLIVINVYDSTMPLANGGLDQTVPGMQTSTQLSGTPTPIYPATCQWTISTGSGVIVDPNDPNTMVSGLTIGENTFVWTCDNGPCGTSTDTVTVFKSLTLGIANEDQVERLFAYDPWTQRLVIGSEHTVTDLVVLDAQGRIVGNRTSGSLRSWDLGQQASGLYVVRAMIDGTLRTQRFVMTR